MKLALGLQALILGAVACAGRGFEGVKPEEIPALEARAAADSNHAGPHLSLGEAYYAARRYPEARLALDRAAELEPTNQETQLYLAFTLDALEQWADARASYQALRAKKPERAVADAIAERLMMLDRKEAVFLARQALENESSLAGETPDAYTVAVLPLQYTGTDSTLKPLERGLAELMVTDLGSVGRLTLVERLQVAALLEEMKLTESGRVDPAGAARSGRLLRASRVVQGTIGDGEAGQLSLNAMVVDAATAGVSATASAQDRLQALFEMEKQIVFAIIEQMGVQLAPAERARIAERPTENVQAFLAYSRGLDAQARGNFSDAMGAFRQAVTLDPSFNAAKAAGQSSAQLSRGANADPARLAPRLSAMGENEVARQRLRETVARVTPAGGDLAGQGHQGGGNDRDNAGERKPVQEGTDTQGPTDATRNTTVTVTVTRPTATNP